MEHPMESLLAFASAKGFGNLGDIRSACDYLEIPSMWQALHTLDSLGHIDIRLEYEGPAWSCADPALATLPGDRVCAVACGARAPGLRELLASDTSLSVEEHPHAPQVWVCRGSAEEIEGAAKRSRVFLTPEPPAQTLARAIPSLRRYLDVVARPIVLPSSKTPPSSWDPATGQWSESAMVNRDGLWRIVDRYTGRRVHLVRLGPSILQIRDLGAGHAAASAIAGRPYVRYDSAERRVIVDKGRLLPRLHSRALALCSGRPPPRGNDGLHFSSVPLTIARTIILKLGLEETT